MNDENAARIGCIVLKMWRAKLLPDLDIADMESFTTTITDHPIHETQKKAGGHRIQCVILIDLAYQFSNSPL